MALMEQLQTQGLGVQELLILRKGNKHCPGKGGCIFTEEKSMKKNRDEGKGRGAGLGSGLHVQTCRDLCFPQLLQAHILDTPSLEFLCETAQKYPECPSLKDLKCKDCQDEASVVYGREESLVLAHPLPKGTALAGICTLDKPQSQ